MNLSPLHMLVIGVIALLLFGNRLPEVARSIGKAFNEFKRGLKEVQEDEPTQTRDEQRPPPQKLPNADVSQQTQTQKEREHETVGRE